jgi:hypothetical protein
MNYFRRVIDRTLGPRHEVKPASTPDSIRENESIEGKGSQTKREQKIVQSIKEPNSPVSAANPRKVDLLKDDGSRIKVSNVPEKHQEDSKEMPLSPYANEIMPSISDPPDIVQDRSIPVTKESRPPHWQEQKATVSPVSAEVFTAEAEFETKIGIDKVLQHARRQPPSSETDLRIQESDKSAEPIRAVPQSLSESAASFAGDEKTDNTLPGRGLKPLHASASELSKNYSLETGAEIRPAEQQERPMLVPAGSNMMKYSADVQQPEETVVTINIGKIEVRTDPAGDLVRAPRPTFSPSLSLTDYLKQRSKASTR